MSKVKLCACIIAKNDEKYIGDSVQKMQNYADEIIVADIGSADNTADIAENAGAEVFKIQWGNDFSRLKNFCIDNSTADWILFLYANEVIPEEHLSEIAPNA